MAQDKNEWLFLRQSVQSMIWTKWIQMAQDKNDGFWDFLQSLIWT